MELSVQQLQESQGRGSCHPLCPWVAAGDTGKSSAVCPVLGSSFGAAGMQVMAQFVGTA